MCGSSRAHRCEAGGAAWGGRPPRRRGVVALPQGHSQHTGLRRRALRSWQSATLRASAGRTSRRRAAGHRQSARTRRRHRPARRAARTWWCTVAGCHAYITVVSGVRRLAGREWRIDHEDMSACSPTNRSRRRTRHRPRRPPATPVRPTQVEPSPARLQPHLGGGSCGTGLSLLASRRP